MLTEEFFSAVLPAEGLRCIAIQLESGFRHVFIEDNAQAAQFAQAMDRRGRTVYFATASYRTDESRKGSNVQAVRSLWLDVDCGEGKPYATQEEGTEALNSFLAASKLPQPLVVSSGGGLHVYWPLTVDVSPDQWRSLAAGLRAATGVFGFNADPARTADIASVLRPVGTHNRKRGEVPVEVLLDGSQPTACEPEALGRLLPKADRREHQSSDDLRATPYVGAPTDATLVAERCGQMRAFRDSRGNIPEPQWYAGLQLLKFCIDGERLAHEWSSGHPDYSAAGTDRKLQQLNVSGVGPTTCAHLERINPGGCDGCRFRGHITTPLQTGRVAPPERGEPGPDTTVAATDNDEPPTFDGDGSDPTGPGGGGESSGSMAGDKSPESVVEPPTGTPAGYRRGDGGVWARIVNEDTGLEDWTCFCPIDHFPVTRFKGDVELMRIAVNKPRDGWEYIDIPTEVLGGRSTDLTKELAKHGVVLAEKGAKLEKGYLIDWWNKIQAEADATRTVRRLGWQPDNSFVCGDRKYLPNGTVDKVQLHADIAGQTAGFEVSGDLETWKRIAAVYNRPGMEPYQFAVACGFGAPLMQLAANGIYAGAFIHMTSQRGGQGKTTAQNVALSIYGRPDALNLRAPDGKRGGDTELAVLGRIGVYSNLPVILDETTNAAAPVLSNFAYAITSGRPRIRSKQDGTENKHDAEWRTLALASGNASAITRIAASKPGANAEALRIFEYEVISKGHITKIEADKIFPLTYVNHGVAGDVYLQWLTANRDEAVKVVQKFSELVDREVGIGSDERYWSVTAGVTLAGAFIANKLGLLGYDVGKLFRWTAQTIYQMRDMLKSDVQTPVASLLAFINDNVDKVLAVSKTGDTYLVRNGRVVRGPLMARIDLDTNLMYVSARALIGYLIEKQVDPRAVERELVQCTALKTKGLRKSLGDGSEIHTMPESCWVIDLSCTEIAGDALRIVEKPASEVYA